MYVIDVAFQVLIWRALYHRSGNMRGDGSKGRDLLWQKSNLSWRPLNDGNRTTRNVAAAGGGGIICILRACQKSECASEGKQRPSLLLVMHTSGPAAVGFFCKSVAMWDKAFATAVQVLLAWFRVYQRGICPSENFPSSLLKFGVVTFKGRINCPIKDLECRRISASNFFSLTFSIPRGVSKWKRTDTTKRFGSFGKT